MTDRRPTTEAPGPTPRITAIHVLAALTVVLGAAMIISALTGGGGIGSYGVLIGALFIAAGTLRLRLLTLRSRR